MAAQVAHSPARVHVAVAVVSGPSTEVRTEFPLLIKAPFKFRVPQSMWFLSGFRLIRSRLFTDEALQLSSMFVTTSLLADKPSLTGEDAASSHG